MHAHRAHKLLGFSVALLVVGLSGCGKGERAVGDGQLTDYGYFSYFPRFRVALDPIRVSTSTTSYELSRLPSAEYELRIVPLLGGEVLSLSDWNTTWDQLRTAQVSVKAKVENLETHKQRHFSAQLAGGWNPGAGVLEPAFYCPELEHIPLGGDARFTIEVAVDPESALSNLTLKPILLGGGITK
jgi:hypothetical protein